MKKVMMSLLLAAFSLGSLPGWAADRLDGFLTLAADDNAALAQVKKMPERHVMMYFGDYQH